MVCATKKGSLNSTNYCFISSTERKAQTCIVEKGNSPLDIKFSLPHNPDSLLMYLRKTLFKNIVEKGEMLVTSIFSFSHNVFLLLRNKFPFLSHKHPMLSIRTCL